MYTQYSWTEAQEEPTVPLAQLSPAAAEAAKSLAQNKGFTVYKVYKMTLTSVVSHCMNSKTSRPTLPVAENAGRASGSKDQHLPQTFTV